MDSIVVNKTIIIVDNDSFFIIDIITALHLNICWIWTGDP